MKDVTPEQVKTVLRELADKLEQNNYKAVLAPGQDEEAAVRALGWWTQGYRRAISDIREMAVDASDVPDDISELTG